MRHNPDIKDLYKESVAYAKAHTRYNKDGLVIVEPDNDDAYDELDELYQELGQEASVKIRKASPSAS